MYTVLEADVSGLITSIVLAESRTLALVDTEAGAFIHVLTHRTSQYPVYPLRLSIPLYRVRVSCQHLVMVTPG